MSSTIDSFDRSLKPVPPDLGPEGTVGAWILSSIGLPISEKIQCHRIIIDKRWANYEFDEGNLGGGIASAGPAYLGTVELRRLSARSAAALALQIIMRFTKTSR